MKIPTPRHGYFLPLAAISLLLCSSMAANPDPTQETFLSCLISHSEPSISDLVFFPTNTSYTETLESYIRNLRFSSPSTPKPHFIVTPTHVSHIRAAVLCARAHGLQLRIRSGGHDYDGLSYISDTQFVILDMFNLRSIDIEIEDETAWVQSGATIGEVYYRIAEQSSVHGFPAGICPTVGVGGHLSGGGYGNMMRKHGLSVDNVVDAEIVDANGDVLNRASMGEDLFWAIRGGGGASFGVVVSWKIKLVRVPETVTVFKVERTLEQGLTDIVHKWQFLSETASPDLFIRVVVMPVNRKAHQSVKGKLVALFLGHRNQLLELVNSHLPELGLKFEDCVEMGWIESVLFWSNYPINTPADVLLERIPESEKFLKRKSDYVQEPISKTDLEGVWKKMMELKKGSMALNLYGGRMSEIGEGETPFPHRAGNLFKIQYAVNWKEEGEEASELNLERIRKLHEYMTPYVSKSPRGAYLNYRDVDIGVNGIGSGYAEASVWGNKYFKGNFERLVEVKTMVDPTNFFSYEQSIPSLATWKNKMAG